MPHFKQLMQYRHDLRRFKSFKRLQDKALKYIDKKYYSFGRIALRINARIPAGIRPVVSNSCNLIPKSGI